MDVSESFKWIFDNKDWLFSGVGITFLSLILAIIFFIPKIIKNNLAFTERDAKELEKLVMPLYNNIENKNLFLKGVFGYKDSRREGVKEYLFFWESVQNNKYLGTKELRLAIDNYLKNKNDTVDDRTEDEAYKKVENELFNAVRKRYSELMRKSSSIWNKF